jgi:hypothetical protein
VKRVLANVLRGEITMSDKLLFRMLAASVVLAVMAATFGADPQVEEAKKIVLKYEPKPPATHFFQDHLENVAVGYWHIVPSAAEGKKLALNKEDGKAASNDEKEANWDEVKKAEVCRLPAFYATKMSLKLTLPDAQIAELLTIDLEAVQTQLAKEFPGAPKGTKKYADFPEKAKTALIDMGYTLTVPRLVTRYEDFCKDVANARWTKAADKSHRIGIDENRNADIKTLLQEAAGP